MGIGVICTSFWRYGPDDEFLARPLSIGTMTGAVGNWKGPVRLLENRGLLRLAAHRGRDEPSASKRGLRLSRLVQGMSRLPTWHAVRLRAALGFIVAANVLAGATEYAEEASTWNIEELHTDLKWDLGLSIRAWAKGFVVRVDSAFSEEGVGVQMMISHPFQF